MIGVVVSGLDGVKAALAKLSERESDKAMQMAINKTAQKARSEVNRAILERYAIKADEVRNSIALRQANKRQRAMVAEISIFGSQRKRGRSLNMIHFLSVLSNQVKTRGSRVKRKEVGDLAGQLGFTITKSGGVKKIPGAFVGNKGRTVFRRVGDARKPIEPVPVVGVGQMFNFKGISTRVMQKIDADLLVEINRAVAFMVSKR